MTEIAEFQAKFSKNNLLDDIVKSDFIHKVFNNALKCDLANVQPPITAGSDEQITHDVSITKLMKCHKRKLSDSRMVNETKPCKERRSSIRPKSPNIDILKRAVERLKNADKYVDYRSDGWGTNNSGSSSNEFIGTENEQQIDRAQANKKSIPSSQMQEPHLQKIVCDILKGFKVMIIMRGPPGSGKSFLARQIIDSTTKDYYSNHIFSACDYFLSQGGYFDFKPALIGESHQWNQARIISHARTGWSPIIIDNTNMKKWEMNVFVEIAVQYGYLMKIVRPNTPWSNSVDELVAMNIHDVPRETIKRMMKNYESTTVSDLRKISGLNYTMKMPQYRRLPVFI